MNIGGCAAARLAAAKLCAPQKADDFTLSLWVASTFHEQSAELKGETTQGNRTLIIAEVGRRV